MSSLGAIYRKFKQTEDLSDLTYKQDMGEGKRFVVGMSCCGFPHRIHPRPETGADKWYCPDTAIIYFITQKVA